MSLATGRRNHGPAVASQLDRVEAIWRGAPGEAWSLMAVRVWLGGKLGATREAAFMALERAQTWPEIPG